MDLDNDGWAVPIIWQQYCLPHYVSCKAWQVQVGEVFGLFLKLVQKEKCREFVCGNCICIFPSMSWNEIMKMQNFKRMEILIVFPQLLQLVTTVLCRDMIENTLCPKALVGIFFNLCLSKHVFCCSSKFFEPCELLPKKKK